MAILKRIYLKNVSSGNEKSEKGTLAQENSEKNDSSGKEENSEK